MAITKKIKYYKTFSPSEMSFCFANIAKFLFNSEQSKITNIPTLNRKTIRISRKKTISLDTTSGHFNYTNSVRIREKSPIENKVEAQKYAEAYFSGKDSTIIYRNENNEYKFPPLFQNLVCTKSEPVLDDKGRYIKAWRCRFDMELKLSEDGKERTPVRESYVIIVLDSKDTIISLDYNLSPVAVYQDKEEAEEVVRIENDTSTIILNYQNELKNIYREKIKKLTEEVLDTLEKKGISNLTIEEALIYRKLFDAADIREISKNFPPLERELFKTDEFNKKIIYLVSHEKNMILPYYLTVDKKDKNELRFEAASKYTLTANELKTIESKAISLIPSDIIFIHILADPKQITESGTQNTLEEAVQKAIAHTNQMFSIINVDLTAKYEFISKDDLDKLNKARKDKENYGKVLEKIIFSKQDFYKNKGKKSSYVVAVNSKDYKLDVLRDKLVSKAWQRIKKRGGENGHSAENDYLAMINFGHTLDYKNNFFSSKYFAALITYKSAGHKLSICVQHESGHPKFMMHERNAKSIGGTIGIKFIKGVSGHIKKTIMDEAGRINADIENIDKIDIQKVIVYYDDWMIANLQNIHGLKQFEDSKKYPHHNLSKIKNNSLEKQQIKYKDRWKNY